MQDRVILCRDMPATEYNLYVKQNMTLETWQKHVISLGRHLGWDEFHTNRVDSQQMSICEALFQQNRGTKDWQTALQDNSMGWPDVFMARTLRSEENVFIVWTLMTFGREATEDQLRWLDLFRGQPGCLDASVRYPWELDEMRDLLNRD